MNSYNSWALFDICPCCAVELKSNGCLPDFSLSHSVTSNGCRQYKNKPEPVSRFGENRKIIIKPKSKKTLKKFTKINSDPSKVDRSLIF